MDGSASGERIIAHLACARAVAARSLDPRCRGADREDLIAWGVVGLVQAAQRYRGDLGASFGAYAARRVRGQVLDALRDRDPLTRSARRAFREAQRIREDLPPPYVEISLDRLAELGDGGIAAPDPLVSEGTRPALGAAGRRARGVPARHAQPRARGGGRATAGPAARRRRAPRALRGRPARRPRFDGAVPAPPNQHLPRADRADQRFAAPAGRH